MVDGRKLAILGGVGLLAGGAAYGIQKLLQNAGVLSPSSTAVDPNDPSLQPVPGSSPQAHVAARGVLTQAFQNVMGRAPTLAEIQYAHAVAWLETNYGNGWKGAMIGSNNWGAVQCSASNQGGANCIPYQDSQSSGQTYAISFMKYPDPVSGAEDVIRHIFKLRPITAESLANNEPTFDTSYDMRREKYYGGFCPNATKQYGSEPANASFAHPDRDAGTEACEAEAVAAHAGRAHSIIQNVASALNEAVSVPLGNFDDANKKYLANHSPSIAGPWAGSGTFAFVPSFGWGAVAVRLQFEGDPDRLRSVSWREET